MTCITLRTRSFFDVKFLVAGQFVVPLGGVLSLLAFVTIGRCALGDCAVGRFRCGGCLFSLFVFVGLIVVSNVHQQ